MAGQGSGEWVVRQVDVRWACFGAALNVSMSMKGLCPYFTGYFAVSGFLFVRM